MSMDEKTFRFMLNEDAMATEKLAEGIRAFCADAAAQTNHRGPSLNTAPGRAPHEQDEQLDFCRPDLICLLLYAAAERPAQSAGRINAPVAGSVAWRSSRRGRPGAQLNPGDPVDAKAYLQRPGPPTQPAFDVYAVRSEADIAQLTAVARAVLARRRELDVNHPGPVCAGAGARALGQARTAKHCPVTRAHHCTDTWRPRADAQAVSSRHLQ